MWSWLTCIVSRTSTGFLFSVNLFLLSSKNNSVWLHCPRHTTIVRHGKMGTMRYGSDLTCARSSRDPTARLYRAGSPSFISSASSQGRITDFLSGKFIVRDITSYSSECSFSRRPTVLNRFSRRTSRQTPRISRRAWRVSFGFPRQASYS